LQQWKVEELWVHDQQQPKGSLSFPCSSDFIRAATNLTTSVLDTCAAEEKLETKMGALPSISETKAALPGLPPNPPLSSDSHSMPLSVLM
jgi:hypothetical protein